MDLIFGSICSFHVKGKESNEPSNRLKKNFMNTHKKKNRKENIYRKIQITNFVNI